MDKCILCRRRYGPNHSCNKSLDGKNHWKFEILGREECTEEFNSLPEKERNLAYVNDSDDYNHKDTGTLGSEKGSEEDNADSHHSKLVSSIAGMLGQPAHSDITISVQNVMIPAHQFVLCSQSSRFEEACKEAISNGGSVLKCDEGTGAALWRVLEYLYTGDYSDILSNAQIQEDPELLKHLRVHMLAHAFLIRDLRKYALMRFKKHASNCWDSDVFTIGVHEIYQSHRQYSSPTRIAVARLAVEHAHDLITTETFNDLIRMGGNFVIEFVEHLLGKHKL
ncbi:hypothetical protein BU24DRAFT_419919 [Aaosphaeria arxii CBS 175.79]|uniref:BTB domain-containing protein n=1 Tax=Aaosphaeria arxii CBS 175.79 TaxID=1450172 RepID=A0A6A5XVA6_9PLEO|nr:uncharacterized protein BU24DRAFT_419919 [Aaosphaeria arxii CBS 175.79]KAF2016866.1 hypothetical protein BU24DRAFT_419919 [Aaosphaeria arxii CBS 175.79]